MSGRPGLAGERTAFAWLRTGLSLLGAALVLARLAAGLGTTLGLVASLTSAFLAVSVVLLARPRYERPAVAVRRGRPLPDGRLPAAVSALTVLLGVAALSIVLSR
jgi:putative membrane protein